MNVIPNEVLWVWGIRNLGQPIGIDLYNKVQEIIDRFPDHFKWEHTYKSIPQEVHEAYRKERYPDLYEFKEEINCGKGILELMRESNLTKEKDPNPIETYFKNLEKQKEDVRKEELRIKSIWKKHYSKYKLSYR